MYIFYMYMYSVYTCTCIFYMYMHILHVHVQCTLCIHVHACTNLMQNLSNSFLSPTKEQYVHVCDWVAKGHASATIWAANILLSVV